MNFNFDKLKSIFRINTKWSKNNCNNTIINYNNNIEKEKNIIYLNNIVINCRIEINEKRREIFLYHNSDDFTIEKIYDFQISNSRILEYNNIKYDIEGIDLGNGKEYCEISYKKEV